MIVVHLEGLARLVLDDIEEDVDGRVCVRRCGAVPAVFEYGVSMLVSLRERQR